MPSRTKRPSSELNRIEPAAAALQPGAERHPTVIAASLQFAGEIKSAGSVRIEGQVTGRVTAHSVTLGPRGGIEGEVAAQSARIDGLIEGGLTADTVTLGSGARVVGDITHRSLSMEPGAQFEGRAIHAEAAGLDDGAPPDADRQ
ncbi:MAG: polymer-forming cytoskeletal protein [Kiloniellales bacterium]|nr:polymer-forming cytoskeletal protein [Kiloniellales bacterium]